MKILIGIVLLIGSSLGICNQIVTRREIRELSARDLKNFFGALNKLHHEKWEGLSRYEEFSRIHVEYKHVAHFKPMFLPWHRHFLRQLETELQRINPEVVLPYWDWTVDSQEPHSSPVLSRKFIGGNGDPSHDYCLRDGPFSNWQMDYPSPHCLRRNYDNGNKLSPFSSPEAMSIDLNEPKFSDFSAQLEVKHGSPHVNIGGDKGDFFPMHSPNDPVFFLHHTFIDMLWAEWQARHPEAEYEGDRYHTSVNVEDYMLPFNVTVASTLDTHLFCYDYPRYPRVVVSQETPPRLRGLVAGLARRNPFMGFRRNHLTQANVGQTLPSLINKLREFLPDLDLRGLKFKPLQKRKPLPAAFVEMNDMDPEFVKESLTKENSIVDLLNSIPNFISLSQTQSLLNAHELLSSLHQPSD